jgi:hypothetical protein
VLDAKYKQTNVSVPSGDVEAEFTVGSSRIRVPRSDIYQAVAYAGHEKYAPATVALIYPVALGEQDDLPDSYRIEGFMTDVTILFRDVGKSARSNLPAFLGELDGLQPVLAGADGTSLLGASMSA